MRGLRETADEAVITLANSDGVSREFITGRVRVCSSKVNLFSNAPSSARNPCADWYRSSGLLARSLRVKLSTSAGTRGFSLEGAGGSSWMTRAQISIGVEPEKAGVPVTHS